MPILKHGTVNVFKYLLTQFSVQDAGLALLKRVVIELSGVCEHGSMDKARSTVPTTLVGLPVVAGGIT